MLTPSPLDGMLVHRKMQPSSPPHIMVSVALRCVTLRYFSSFSNKIPVTSFEARCDRLVRVVLWMSRCDPKSAICRFEISALKVFGQVTSTLNKRTFRECIDAIVKSFPEEDVFESLINFLTTSVEVRLHLMCITFPS